MPRRAHAGRRYARLALAGLVLATAASGRVAGAGTVRIADTLPADPSAGPTPLLQLVKVAGEDRLALRPCPTGTALELPLAGPAAAPTGPDVTLTTVLPDELRGVPWVTVQLVLHVAGLAAPVPLPVAVVRPDARGTVAVEVQAALVGAPNMSLVARVAPPPDLGGCDVVSAPVAIEAGATFAAAVAVEELAWPVTTRPVELRATVLDDAREHPLVRRVLDPQRAEDRRWIELRGDLGPFAGRSVRLRLSAGPAGGGTGSTLPLWADPRVLAARAPGAIGVLLISLDTLRAKSVGTYGARRPTTPTLDRRVGADGVVFEQAYTTAPHTLPSHMSVFTGLFPRTHGVLPGGHSLAPSVSTLPEMLRAAGLETAAFTEDAFVIPEAGFRRGFASYVENKSVDFHEPEGLSVTTFAQGLDWLAHHGDHPFFLFLHTYEVHAPYTPRPPYDSLFEPVDPTWRAAEQDLLRYEQEARYLDDQVAVLLDGLDALGLATRTLVIVMADHGEEFLEHGRIRHGYQLWPETTHVPLMMRLPGVVPAGLRIATPVSLVDLLPTILDALGLPPEPGAEGTSLLPLVLGVRATLARPGVLFAAGKLTGMHMPDCHCIVGLRQPDRVVCTDPVRDPNAETPLAKDRPCVRRAEVETARYRSMPRASVSRPAVTLPPVPVDAERQEKLRALGYLDDEP